MANQTILWAELDGNVIQVMSSDAAISMSEIEKRYTARGTFSGFEMTITFSELPETKHLFARDFNILAGKINNLGVTWAKKWAREQKLRNQEASKEEAERLSTDAQNVIERLENTLAHTLDVDDAIDFEALKDKTEFPKPKPEEPKAKSLPQAPEKSRYSKEITFFQRIMGKKQRLLDEQEAAYQTALNAWKATADAMEKKHAKAIAEYQKLTEQWNLELERYLETQAKTNREIDEFRQLWESGDAGATEEYSRMVLENSDYPDCLPSEFKLEYDLDHGLLIVDFRLPAITDIPTLTEVSYIQSRSELKEKHISASRQKQLYNDVCYQMCLRTIHELFEADVNDHLQTIVFNGFVSQRSAATGNLETAYVLTVQTPKNKFLEFDLAHVDPKTCFKSMKGIGSTDLTRLTPVQPVIDLNRNDSRFREGYDVINSVSSETNLAAMDWVDFEHLVRQLFESEFSQSGGEVKVTQASADKGVDAIAFDPDPIRGGKIVIQAKRYTNTVGVSAVRDLYGTLLNEGGSKGILVTTSDFGPDSYEFAQNKPITLLNGANLLALLEKHGTRAKIDIAEAKKLAGK